MNDALKKSDLSAQELINILKSIDDFSGIYKSQVRHYTLEKHTFLVLSEYEKYFLKVPLPITCNLFKLALGLHDIGKPRAIAEGNKNGQHLCTVKLINSIRGLLPFSSLEMDLCISLLQGDPIGMYMQSQISLDDAKNQIEEQSAKTFLNTFEFLRLMLIYYQCDTASYTVDAGGLAFLEHLYLYQTIEKSLAMKI